MYIFNLIIGDILNLVKIAKTKDKDMQFTSSKRETSMYFS